MVKNFPGLREEINQKYETAKGNWDLYVPFFELGHNLLKEFSIGVFITPNKWISIGYGNELRKYIANDFIGIAVCSKVKVFDAGNNPLICFFCKRNNKDIFFVEISSVRITLSNLDPA